MEFEDDWWTNPWMVVLFLIAGLPALAGAVAVVLLSRSGRNHGWKAAKLIGNVMAVGWTLWWACDWLGRATDPRFHN